ncbi:13905_t:CDS:2, partial [Racocetra persica]
SYVIQRQAPVSDGCSRIHNEFITKKTIRYADVRNCYKSFPFDKNLASKVCSADSIYVFLNKANEHPPTGFDFRSVDIIAELNKVFKDLTDKSNNDCEVTHID